MKLDDAAGGSDGAGGSERAGDGFAAQLEAATRGLLDVSMQALAKVEEKFGPGYLRALQALDRLGGSKVSELGAALDVLPSTASRLSDRLTAAGLITRTVSKANRRATWLELTAAGRAVLADLTQARTEALAAVTELMTTEQRQALLTGAGAFTAAQRRLPYGPVDAMGAP